MRIRVLGTVDIANGSGYVVAGPAKQSCVLAVLACSPGQPVPVDTLIDRVWSQYPPRHARDALYLYASRLRHVLRSAGIHLDKTGSGYRLDVPPDEVDLHLARTLAAEARAARRAGSTGTAVERYRRATALWRGTPLSGVGGDWAAGVREALDRERLILLGERFEIELELDRHAEVLTELSALASAYPLAEPLVGQLMLALHRSGRTAEALDCFARTRERLREELGVDPGPALSGLHRQLLRGDRSAPALPAPPLAVPRQLPAAPGQFVGRSAQLKVLDRLASANGTAIVIAVIAGMAGIGKTATALHWAHRVTDRFPDGQLYVNLRGFEPTGSPMTPAEAVRGFLDALEVPPHRIPSTLDAQAGLYRSLVAGRRILVVLDNARDAEQVRPLLPGSPGCLVLVTSRSQLTGLVAAEQAHPLALDLLTGAESRTLLARRLGDDRVAAEPAAVGELIARCARLPMALAVVAARAATNPGLPLDGLAGQLREAGGGLDPFTGEDPATDARVVFSWSYRALGEPAARLFRLLGLHPGAELTTPAVASLADLPPDRARSLLAELARAHLLTEAAPDRFVCHDLLRAYATELVYTVDSEPDRRAAVRRLLDHYLHTALAADRLIHPNRHPISVPAPVTGVALEPLGDAPAALAWCAAEYAGLLAAFDLAARAGFDRHTWQLGWTLMNLLQRRGRFQQQAEISATALAAAERLHDRAGQAHAHRALARAYTQLDRFDDSEAHLRQALDLAGELGDRAGQAQTHLALSWALERQARYAEALEQAEQGLALFRVAEHRVGQARALGTVGWYHSLLGKYDEALTYCQQSVAELSQLGERHAEAASWDTLGHAHHHLGNHEKSTECYHRAVDLYHALGDRHVEATVLLHLGDTREAAGDLAAAELAWQRALDILDDLGHADAGQARARLTRR